VTTVNLAGKKLDGILDNLVDTPRLQYARQKQRQQDEPFGVNFDALSLLNVTNGTNI